MRWRYRETVLALTTLAFFVTMVGRLVISPLVPDIAATFDVSYSLIGLALTGMWLAYGLAQFPSGILAERFGERYIILVAVGGTAAMALVLAVSPVLALFIVCTVLIGGVAGLHYSVAIALLARTYDDVGTAIGIHNGGGTFAGLVTPVIVAWIAVTFGWRPAILFVAVVGVPIFFLFAWFVRPTPPSRPGLQVRDRVSSGFVGEFLTRPAIAVTLVLAIVTEFAWQGMFSFLPTFLIAHRGLSTTAAGALFSLYFLTQGVGQIVVGTITDRIGTDRAMAVCMAIGAIGILTVITVPGNWIVVVSVVCIGIGMSFSPAIMARFLQQMTAEERSAGFGLVRTVYMMAASLGSVVTGTLADVAGWDVAFGLILGLLLFVLVVLGMNRLVRVP